MMHFNPHTGDLIEGEYPAMARDYDADILTVLIGRAIPATHAQGAALGGIAAVGLFNSTYSWFVDDSGQIQACISEYGTPEKADV